LTSNQTKTKKTITGNVAAKYAKINRAAPSVVTVAAPAVASLSAMNRAIIHNGDADVGVPR